MPRSTYVYVVLKPPPDTIVATFTVKYECVNYLRRYQGDTSKMTVERHPDALKSSRQPAKLGSVKDFLESEK